MDPMLQVSTVPSDQNQLITISKLTFDEIQMAHPNPYIKKKLPFWFVFSKMKKELLVKVYAHEESFLAHSQKFPHAKCKNFAIFFTLPKFTLANDEWIKPVWMILLFLGVGLTKN